MKLFSDGWTGILRKQCDRTYQRKRLTDKDRHRRWQDYLAD